MLSSKRNTLEEGKTRRSVPVSLPIESWRMSDWVMSALEDLFPANYGWVMMAGLARFRQRLGAEGGSLVTLQKLLEEFDRFEFFSRSSPLRPGNRRGDRETRDLEISLPNGAWRIFDGILQDWEELRHEIKSRLTDETFLGYFLLFGLWSLKEFLLEFGNPETTMEQLSLELQAAEE